MERNEIIVEEYVGCTYCGSLVLIDDALLGPAATYEEVFPAANDPGTLHFCSDLCQTAYYRESSTGTLH